MTFFPYSGAGNSLLNLSKYFRYALYIILNNRQYSNCSYVNINGSATKTE